MSVNLFGNTVCRRFAAVARGNASIIVCCALRCCVTFSEVLNSSDVPGGVVNILTGKHQEMIAPLTTHMDVNAMMYSGQDMELLKELQESASLNLKRVFHYELDWMKPKSQDLYMIENCQEIKTTWHPIENIGGATSTY